MNRLLALVSLVCIAFNSYAQTVPKDEATFTEYVSQALKREVGNVSVSVMGPLSLSAGPLQANLDRIFAFCRANDDACAAEVDRYVKGAAQV